MEHTKACPVCAEREVIAGYNDLATTDRPLLSEWDYEQNKLKPTEVSRTSAKRAWWKCRHGHSWSMKINDFGPLFIDASGYTDDSVMTIGFGLDLDKIDFGYNLLYIKHFN